MNEKVLEFEKKLPAAPAKGGLYTPAVQFANNLLYISGCGCNTEEISFVGKLGKELTVEEGQIAAKFAMMNVLAVIRNHLGSLERVKSIVKILVFVAGTDTFFEQPQVANGASGVLLDLFENLPSRSAVGVNSLPGNIPVEIEAIVEIKNNDE